VDRLRAADHPQAADHLRVEDPLQAADLPVEAAVSEVLAAAANATASRSASTRAML